MPISIKITSFERRDFELQNRAFVYRFRSSFGRNIKLKIKNKFFEKEIIKLSIIIDWGAKSINASTIL